MTSTADLHGSTATALPVASRAAQVIPARIDALDYLRGLLALAVMVYHYASWSGGASLGAESVLGRLGIYAVSGFYVLSGLSLGLVYRGRIHTGRDVGAFAVRRLFRIAPVFWLATTATLWLGEAADGAKLWLNYSLAFGFVAPDAYIATGAWSIGNEMVFYALLPWLLLDERRLPWAWAASLVVAGLFALHFDAATPLRTQWATYIHPANQVFLFLGGAMIARASWGCWRWMLAGAAVFVLWPAFGDKAGIVAGAPRLMFSAACLVFVLGLYRWQPTIDGVPARVLAFFGRGCYSIYLLHPIVAQVCAPWIGYLGSAAVTLAIAAASYRWLEAPAMALGARLAARVRPPPLPR